MLTNNEKGYFLKLFNRGGHVLDFSKADFDVFTMQSVGVPLCGKYQLPKGKSLNAFIAEADSNTAYKLLADLLEYYEAYYGAEYDDSCQDDCKPFGYDKTNKHLYQKCKVIADREKSLAAPLDASASFLKDSFNSEYMNTQIDLLMEMRTSHPTDAIGKSKDLIESCCKTILEAQGINWDKNWNTARFAKETAACLEITVNDVTDDAPEGAIVKRILGSLQGLATGVSEFRNAYGSGHGKSSSFRELPVRHAKLAVGSSVTLVEYYWETYEWKRRKGTLQ